MPVARTADDLESIYTLNETASFLWNAMDGQHTLADLVDLLVSEYEVTREAAWEDVVALIEQLEQIRAIELVTS